MSSSSCLKMGTYRYVLFAVACVHVLLASGAAYGWTALRPVLYDSGVFAGFNEWERGTKMNMVSTLGISANALCKLPLGVFMDYFGPRYTAVLGAIFLSSGCLLLAYGGRDSLGAIGGGYFLLGVSGPFIQMPCFQFSNLFPDGKTTAISFMITCFELSTGVFYVFNVVHGHLHVDMSVLFAAYGSIGIFILLTAVLMWPDQPHVEYRPEEEGADEDEEDILLEPEPLPPLPILDEEDGVDSDQAEELYPFELHKQPLSRQLMSVEFAYVSIFLITHIFRQGFVLSTMGLQLEHFFSPEAAVRLSDTFSVVLPLGFLPMMLCTATGFSGYLLNRPNIAFVVVTLLSQVYGLLFLIPHPAPYLVLFIIFPVARQLVFSTFFSYSAQTFGFQSFGRISGIASTAAGCIQLTQNMLVGYVVDPAYPWLKWETADTALALLPLLLLLLPVYRIVQQCLAGETVDESFSREGSRHGGDGPMATPLLIAAAESMPISTSLAGSYAEDSAFSRPMSVPSFGSVPVPANYASYMLAGTPPTQSAMGRAAAHASSRPIGGGSRRGRSGQGGGANVGSVPADVFLGRV